MLPCIRCATLDGFVELANSLGLDPSEQLIRAGLEPADVAAPDKWIPAVSAAWLLEMSAVESGCEDFGLRLSERRRLATLGPLSVVLREEPDLRSALHLLIRHERSYNEAIELELSEANGQAVLRVWLNLGEPAPTRQGLELAAAAFLGITRELMGRDWHPRGVYFTHRAPERLTTHQQLFGTRLHFDQEFTGLLFGTDELDGRNVLADPLLRPYRAQFLQAVPPPRGRTLADQVRELVETLLPLGRHSMRRVASSLGLTPRTLRRRLEEQRESYSSILDSTRAALVERYLSNERLPLTDIAHQLGFAAPSAFSRWFHRRFGMSPTEWRRVADGIHSGHAAVAATHVVPHR